MRGTNIPNPLPPGHPQARVSGDIPEAAFNYFFRHLYPTGFGPRQAMIATFFDRFHQACLAEGIKSDRDDLDNLHDAQVAKLLDRLNFNPLV